MSLASALASLARTTRRAPRSAAAFVVAMTVVALFLLPRFSIEADVASMLPPDHPAVALSYELDSDSSRMLFLVLEGRDLANELESIVAALRESQLLERVDATWEEVASERTRVMRGAPLPFLTADAVERIEERIAGPGRAEAVDDALATLSEDPFAGADLVRADPLGLRWLVEPASTVPAGFRRDTPYIVLESGLALVRVLGHETPFDVAFSESVIADLDARLAEFDAIEHVSRIGGYDAAVRDSRRIAGDLSTSMSSSIPLVLLFLIITTRGFVRAHLLLLPVALAVLWALGIGGALLGPLTPLAVSAAAILVGLGVDFAIHYGVRFDEERLDGTSDDEAIVRAHSGTGRAILAGMATTLAGFLSFSFGSFPGLFGLGMLLALGLTFAFVASLAVLPLTLPRLRPRATVVGPLVRATESIARSRAGLPVALGLIALAASGWLVVGSRGIVFDADPAFMRPAEESRAARELGERLGFSPLPLVVLTSPDDVESTRSAIDELTGSGLVRFAEGPHALAPSAEERERALGFRERTAGWVDGAVADFEAIGFDGAEIRPALEAQAALFEADPGLDPRTIEWDGESWIQSSLYASAPLSDAAERQRLRAAIDDAFESEPLLVDPYGLTDELGPVLAGDLRRSLIVCGGAVLLLVALWIRRPKESVLALLPTFAGLGIALGGLVLFGVPLHPGNFVAVPLVLGLGVDDGIHIVMRHGEDGTTAGTAQAVWSTSATTAIGFGSLVLAESPALASLGAIALVGVLVCFVTSALVLPALLARQPR